MHYIGNASVIIIDIDIIINDILIIEKFSLRNEQSLNAINAFHDNQKISTIIIMISNALLMYMIL